MRICVAGAGIVGLTTAYALARRGHDVTVVDAGSGPGQGTSGANGGQLSYSYVAPLADPSIWQNLPSYLLHPDSPLTFRPRLDLNQWRWCLQFLMACNAKASARATAALLRLAFFSRDCLAALQGELALDFDFRQAGKLVMVSTPAGLKAASAQVEFQRSLGCEQEVLDAKRCMEIEPALAPSAARWLGGVYTASEQVGDCAAFCGQLAARLARSAGRVHFVFDTAIAGALVERQRLVALSSSAGDIAADHFILANGCGSARLAAALGFTLPVYPLKGYSVTLAAGAGCGLPSVSITDVANKIVYARLGKRLRVAGMLEIVGHDLSVDARRCAKLAAQAGTLFPGISHDIADMSPWAGARPATPTGLPVVGRGPLTNLSLNVGDRKSVV